MATTTASRKRSRRRFIEHHRRADEEDEAEDVHDLDDGVQPEPVPHRLGEPAGLERDQPRRADGWMH